jgi:hypothetical protein
LSKLPAIQFYPGDWRKDVGVQSLTFHDRGVWFEILMLMHESPVRGKLMLGSKAMSDEVLAGILRIDISSLLQTLETLIDRNVTERDKRTGALINRRMIRDDEARSESRGKLQGWRKAKKQKENGNDRVTSDETVLYPLSSSSSSSSISSSKQTPKSPPETDHLQPEMVAKAVQMQAGIVTDRAYRTLYDVAKREQSLGIPDREIINAMVEAWNNFRDNAAKLEYQWGAEKFFGEGYWKNVPGWPWKESFAPKPTRKYMAD